MSFMRYIAITKLTTAVQSVVEPCIIAVYYTTCEISSANMGF